MSTKIIPEPHPSEILLTQEEVKPLELGAA
jgi:hypothetical protein